MKHSVTTDAERSNFSGSPSGTHLVPLRELRDAVQKCNYPTKAAVLLGRGHAQVDGAHTSAGSPSGTPFNILEGCPQVSEAPVRQTPWQSRKSRLMAATGGRCWYCGDHLPRHRVTMDHVVPLARGGDDSEGNLVIACLPCNDRKGAGHLEDFRLRIARHKAGWPYFSPAQIKWLLDNGTLAEPPRFEFYGEALHRRSGRR